MGFGRYIVRYAYIRIQIEDDTAVGRTEPATLRRRRRMHERALSRIVQKHLGEFCTSLSIGFPAFGLGRSALGLVCAFELMVPRGFAKQLFDVRRRIVR